MCAFQECACLSVCVMSPISSESPCLAMCNVTWDPFVECVTIEWMDLLELLLPALSHPCESSVGQLPCAEV